MADQSPYRFPSIRCTSGETPTYPPIILTNQPTDVEISSYVYISNSDILFNWFYLVFYTVFKIKWIKDNPI